MNYPLTLGFKLVEFAPQVALTDAGGGLVFFIKQTLSEVKDAVTVFADAEQSRPLYTVSADQAPGVAALYAFADMGGAERGALRREGVRSLWRGRYDILAGESVILTIQEERPWIKALDELVDEIPFAGQAAEYFFHPAYLVNRPEGDTVLRMEKQPAVVPMLDETFRIERKLPLEEGEETQALLALITMVLRKISGG
jgi:hypothetical protein